MTNQPQELLDKAIDTSTNISSEIVQYSKQRFSHPLFLSFIVSFLFYNWRPISIYLFTDKSIEETLLYINQFDSFWAVGIPVLGASAYTLIFPYLRNLISSITGEADKKQKEIEHNRIMKLAEYQLEISEKEYEIATRRNGTAQLSALRAVITQNQSTIETLNNALQVSENSLKTQSKEIEEIKISLSNQNSKDRNRMALQQFNQSLKLLGKLIPSKSFDDLALLVFRLILLPNEKEWLLNTVEKESSIEPTPLCSAMIELLQANRLLTTQIIDNKISFIPDRILIEAIKQDLDEFNAKTTYTIG